MTIRRNQEITRAIWIAIGTFMIVFLAGAIHDVSLRYQQALMISKERAHTNLGKEGYEYIFEPNTHILVDKILPNEDIIFTYIFVSDYLGLDLVSGCWFLDRDICRWIQYNIFYFHDSKLVVSKLVLIAGCTAIILGTVFYLARRTYSSITAKRHINS